MSLCPGQASQLGHQRVRRVPHSPCHLGEAPARSQCMKIKGWLSCPGLGQPASQVSSLSLRHERPTWELTQSPSPISFPAPSWYRGYLRGGGGVESGHVKRPEHEAPGTPRQGPQVITPTGLKSQGGSHPQVSPSLTRCGAASPVPRAVWPVDPRGRPLERTSE